MTDDLVRHVEVLVDTRAAELRTQLRVLISKIEVKDFHLVDGRVTWTVIIPPTLLTLVHQLPDALSPHAD